MSIREVNWYAGYNSHATAAGLQIQLNYEGEINGVGICADSTELNLPAWSFRMTQDFPVRGSVNQVALALLSALNYRITGEALVLHLIPAVVAREETIFFEAFGRPYARFLIAEVRQLMVLILSDATAVELDKYLRLIPARVVSVYPAATVATVATGATQRALPWYLVEQGFGLQLGQGREQRRASSSMGLATGIVASVLAGDKALYQILQDRGIPVPETRVMESAQALGLVAFELGFPLVVKPSFSSHSEGVTVAIDNQQALEQAFQIAQAIYPIVVVQREQPGEDFRACVVAGRLTAMHRFISPPLIGDGQSTIAELIDVINKEPLRNQPGVNFTPQRVAITDELTSHLARQGYELATVLAPGQQAELLWFASVRRGGIAEDCLATVHPDTVAMIERAARLLDVPNAGIDIISDDISRSWREGGVALIDINVSGSTRSHIVWQDPKPLAGKLIDSMWDATKPATIPTVVCLGLKGEQLDSLAQFLFLTGLAVAKVIDGKASVDGFDLQENETIHSSALEAVYRDPEADVVLLSFSEDEFLRSGIPWQHCASLVVLDPDQVSNARLQHALGQQAVALVTASELPIAWWQAERTVWRLGHNTAATGVGTQHRILSESTPAFSRLAWMADGKEMFEESAWQLSGNKPAPARDWQGLGLASAVALSIGISSEAVRTAIKKMP